MAEIKRIRHHTRGTPWGPEGNQHLLEETRRQDSKEDDSIRTRRQHALNTWKNERSQLPRLLDPSILDTNFNAAQAQM
eukprot:scaffold83100_cov30-Tisochrysis_lutea.AAC.1